MSEYVTGQLVNHNAQNNSSSKQMYSFPKAKRFFEFRSFTTRNQEIYNIPNTLSHRATSLGFGKKYDITLLNDNKQRLKIKAPYYNISHVRVSSMPNAPRYTFGESREKYAKCMIDNPPIIPCVTSPGPAVYNVRDKAGKNAPKYSFRERIQYKGKAYRLNVPGPGNYGAISMSKDGKYPLSQYRNTEQAAWSKNKEKRFRIRKIGTPGPGKYEVKGLINGKGSIYNSRFKSGTARSMGLKLKSIFDVSPIDSTPGPGASSAFSEFGFYQHNLTESGSFKTEYGSFGHRPTLSRTRLSTGKSNHTSVKIRK